MDGVTRANLERVQSRGSLLQCLRRTGLDKDILEDIADVCEAHDLSALSLAQGVVGLCEATEKLFLTDREVEDLFEACRELCAKEGVIPYPKGLLRCLLLGTALQPKCCESLNERWYSNVFAEAALSESVA